MSSVIIQKVKIKHAGNVIIDTVPPVGTVLINGGDGYTKNKKVSVTLDASDASTGIKDIEVRNVDITVDSSGNETQTVYDFIPLAYEDNFFWNINDQEGIKKVEVKFRDYGNNVSAFKSNYSIRKFYSIVNEEIGGIIKIGNDTYSSTISDGKIYVTRYYPKLLNDFDGEDIVTIIENNNVLYVATNLISTSKVYTYLDGTFLSLNTFDSLIVDLASYGGQLYVALENKELYQKDSSAWLSVNVFDRNILHIDGQLDYLYIIFNDTTDTIQIYNGDSFQEVNITDLFPEIEVEEESSSDESFSSSSSTRGESSSTQTESDSSSTEKDRSTSSVTMSELSSSTKIMTSSSSSSQSLSSSTLEESSGLSSPSSESFSSEHYSSQFSESSDSTLGDSSDSSSSHDTASSLSSSSPSSQSSGDICDCGKFVDNSIYIDSIHLYNLKTIHTYQCNLFGRIVNLGGGWLRVLLYKNTNRSSENEVARSEDFYQMQVDKQINILESNDTGVTGDFMYVFLYSNTIPSNFVILCEGTNTSSDSSESSSYMSSILSYSESQDVMLGTGTKSDPFLVKTAENMVYVNANPNAYFRLYNDIDMSSVESSLMDEYIPIGSTIVPFEGHFNGDGHSIYNFSVNRPGQDNIGLFGYTKNATITGLSLFDANITGRNAVGSIVGRALGGLIEKCFVFGGIVSGSGSVGGLVGYLDADAEILNCYSRNGSLVGVTTVGGLVGFRDGSSNITYCYSTSPNISAATNRGGLIADSGLVVDTEGEVISSYWDVSYTGLASSDGGVGKTTLAMKAQQTFIGWNFISIWGIGAGFNDGYPYLKPIITNDSSSSSTDILDLSSVSSTSSLYDAEQLLLGEEITW